ncbi:MAG TPA: transposase, partial [Tissierellaceae bacterium]|nr:transposase [Tissierellaceae bacterium]
VVLSKHKKGKYRDWITEEGLLLIEGWARDGLVDEEIAKNIGIHPSTLYDWKNKFPEISEALKKGKEVVDRLVENALLKRALGYEYEEVQTYIEDGGGKQKKKITKTIKHIPPDTTAIAIWLNNRKPADWKRNRGKEELDREMAEFNKEMAKLKMW